MELWRLPYMLSLYNMCLAYAYLAAPAAFPEPLVEVLRSIAVFIGIAVAFFYMKKGVHGVKRFYDRMWYPAPLAFWLAVDFMVHFAPIAILGLPQHLWGVVVAIVVILLWYVLAIRDRVHDIYFRGV